MKTQRFRLGPMLGLMAAVVVTVATLGHADAGNGRSSWGWAKPLNQRSGAFYTSNKARKNTSGCSTRSSSRSTWFSPSRSSRMRSTKSSTPTTAPDPVFFRPGRVGLIPFDGVGRYPYNW
ncbi:MAG: hypothetical protein AAF670_14675 [Planctomycetota bacterium]